MEEETYEFTGKTVDEAIEAGLKELNVTLSDAEIEIVEKGKKGLFRSVNAKVKITVKKKPEEKKVEAAQAAQTQPENNQSDGERAVEFINGLLPILEIEGTSAVISEEDNIEIEITSEQSSKVIGKRGEVLDAIQSLAGAAANIGREDYRKVVVDCEKYRARREETLRELAAKVAAKAVETGRKIILEPMNPYERRIIHSALADNAQVKTASEGVEPDRRVVVIPEGAKPYDRGIRYGSKGKGRPHGTRGRGKPGGAKREFSGKREYGEKREYNGEKREYSGERQYGEKREYNGERQYGEKREYSGERRYSDNRYKGGRGDRGDRRPSSNQSGAKRKKEIYFGTYLGNSNDMKKSEETTQTSPDEE